MSADNTNQTWAAMIYMAGDNNLSEDMLLQLKDIQMINHNENLKIAVQYDPNADDISTQRYIFQKGKGAKADAIWESWAGKIDEESERKRREYYEKKLNDKISDIGFLTETNTGSLWTLFNFMMWSMEKCPADRYMLIISGHGSGLEAGFLAIDQESGDALSIPELELALFLALNPEDEEKRGKLAILGFDTCLMSSIEVGYELRRHAEFMLAAEGFVDNAGWCFRKIFNELAKDTNISAREFAEKIVEVYLIHYLDYIATGMSVDFAACDLTQGKRIKIQVNNLARVLLEKLEKDENTVKNKLLLAHWEAQTYKNDSFVDLYDLCLRLEEYFPDDDEILSACYDLKGVISGEENSFVVKSGYVGPAFQRSFGISIHFPWAKLLPEYLGKEVDGRRKLQFDFLREPDNSSKYEPTKWREFVEKFVKITRIQPRHTEQEIDGSWQNLPESLSQLKEWYLSNISQGNGEIILEEVREDPLTGRPRVDPLTGRPRIDPLTGRPKGSGFGVGSMKNPPRKWRLEDWLIEAIDCRIEEIRSHAESGT